MRKYAATMNLSSPCVKFTGSLSSNDVASKMRESDAVLLFSRKENFPCVIAEAWATGIPVITSDVGGIAEHLDDERGILVDSGDEKALAEAILSLDRVWDKEAIRKYAENHFSVMAVTKAYTKAYNIALDSIE